ncbi:MAG TPA: Gfo/Idh/MocA family oxidoreductase [Solirubrobacteraceae bacterium]|jgi:predicted dehydrogenase|nr:Gfo/Idh/MocA family oxidoreductase [Solirubrobacteraceae bacterium]
MSTGATPTLAVGLLGSAFMGQAHSRALYLLRTLEEHPAALPQLHTICGRNRERLEGMQRRYGWRQQSTDWRTMVADPEIQLFVNAATNELHAEPTIAAMQQGKHVLCEKPLARTATEAHAMLAAARQAEVVHMCAFNYRFFPAIRLAWEMIQAGEIGEPLHFRSRFLLSSGADPESPETAWRLQAQSAGSGVVGDVLAHHIDLARYLLGEPTSVDALTRTWTPERHGVTVDVDDAVVCTMEFAQGAIGVLEATRATPGHVLDSGIEIDGTRASLRFAVQRVNELTLSRDGRTSTIEVTAPEHPFLQMWWPRGHGIGWGDSFVHELRHFLGAAADAWPVAPHGATFEDGYRCALICDAVLASAASGTRQPIPQASAGGQEVHS